MSKKLWIVFAVAACCALMLSFTLALAGPVSSQLSADEMKRLRNGEIIVKNKMDEDNETGYGVAYGIMRGSVDDFWSVIFDYDNYLDIYPRLEKVNLLKKVGNDYYVEFFMDATLTTLQYTTIGTISADRMKMTWTLDESRPHKFQKKNVGHWQLEILEPGVILAEYRVELELSLGVFSSVASKVVRALSKDDLPDVVESTRKRMESGGTWKRKR